MLEGHNSRFHFPQNRGFFSYFRAQCVVDEVEVAMFKHFFFIQNKRWTGIHTLTHSISSGGALLKWPYIQGWSSR